MSDKTGNSIHLKHNKDKKTFVPFNHTIKIITATEESIIYS